MTRTLLVFSIVAFVGIATPGPTVLLALTNGSRFGVRASLPGMAGAVLSDFVLISAVAVGLGALLAASEFWFSVVKWIGVIYLAYLGIRLLRSKGTLDIPSKTTLLPPLRPEPSSFAASSSPSPTPRAICSSRRSCRSSSRPRSLSCSSTLRWRSHSPASTSSSCWPMPRQAPRPCGFFEPKECCGLTASAGASCWHSQVRWRSTADMPNPSYMDLPRPT